MDHFSYLIDQQHRFLLIGIVLLIMTPIFVLSGGTFEPHSGIVYRAEEPKRFWWNVVGYLLAGLFFIGVYFIQNSN
jgi:energy-coupling factor transporter transmembrane protein EcfT